MMFSVRPRRFVYPRYHEGWSHDALRHRNSSSPHRILFSRFGLALSIPSSYALHYALRQHAHVATLSRLHSSASQTLATNLSQTRRSTLNQPAPPVARALATFPRHQLPDTDAHTSATQNLIPRRGAASARRTGNPGCSIPA